MGVNLGSKEFGAPQIGLRTAVLIAQLCTVRSEASVYWEPTLPQGAPSSPGLFNLVCFRMDQRLARFATLIGATYTRYADNIAFSAKRELTAKEIRVVQNIIVQKCHFDLNEKKTRLMRTDSYGGSLRVPGVRVREGQLGLSKSSRRRFRGALHKAVQDGDTAKAWGILAYLRQIYGAEIPEQILSDSLEGLN